MHHAMGVNQLGRSVSIPGQIAPTPWLRSPPDPHEGFLSHLTSPQHGGVIVVAQRIVAKISGLTYGSGQGAQRDTRTVVNTIVTHALNESLTIDRATFMHGTLPKCRYPNWKGAVA